MQNSKAFRWFPPILNLFLLLCSPAYFVECQADCRLPPSPQAIYSQARLPQPDAAMSVTSDGDDSILIFAATLDRSIYRFNTTTEVVSRLASIPFSAMHASLVRIQDGSYLFFGNHDSYPRDDHSVLRFDPQTNNVTIVAEFPFVIRGHFTSAKEPSKIYLLVPDDYMGSVVDIQEFDTSSFCLTRKVGQIAEAGGQFRSSFQFGQYVYIFKMYGTFRIDRDTFSVTQLDSVGMNYATTVNTNKHPYVFGGFSRGEPFPTDGILQYQADDNTFKFIRIEGTPQGFDFKFNNEPAMVFMEKLNRIYFFGGDYERTILDDIWYVDVRLLEGGESPTNCKNKTNL